MNKKEKFIEDYLQKTKELDKKVKSMMETDGLTFKPIKTIFDFNNIDEFVDYCKDFIRDNNSEIEEYIFKLLEYKEKIDNKSIIDFFTLLVRGLGSYQLIKQMKNEAK